MCYSRAEARLLRQPSPLRRVRILGAFYFIGRLFLKKRPLMLTNSDNRRLCRCACFSRIFFRRLLILSITTSVLPHISARKLELDLIRYFSTKKIDRFLCRFNFRLRFFCLIRNEFTVFFLHKEDTAQKALINLLLLLKHINRNAL